MLVGSLYWIVHDNSDDYCGLGLYLGLGHRGSNQKDVFKFLWSGMKTANGYDFMEPRVATFDKPYWTFKRLIL